MNNLELFQIALGLGKPWLITEVDFKEVAGTDGKELHIAIDFYKGSEFSGTDGGKYKAYDTRERTWRHLDFFQHKCYLHCNVPRIRLKGGNVEQVEVPWARAGSGFTLLFEAFCLQLVQQEMPVNKVGQTVGEYGQRIWTILQYYIGKAYDQADHSEVKELGIDETSTRKGHRYITVAVDMDKRNVIRVEEGRDKDSINQVVKYLESKGTVPEQIKEICIDMSPSYIAGCLDSFPNAAITFDRFHVKKLLNVAMDEVRKAERREHDLLKGHKYTFLRNSDKLSDERRNQMNDLLKLYPTLGEAYRLKILFDDFWDMQNSSQAEVFLEDWCQQAEKSGIHPFIKFVGTLKAHWYGIISFTTSRLTNGILEGINTKIQLAKRRARGYRDIKNFISIIYLIAGNLNFNYPHRSS